MPAIDMVEEDLPFTVVGVGSAVAAGHRDGGGRVHVAPCRIWPSPAEAEAEIPVGATDLPQGVGELPMGPYVFARPAYEAALAKPVVLSADPLRTLGEVMP